MLSTHMQNTGIGGSDFYQRRGVALSFRARPILVAVDCFLLSGSFLAHHNERFAACVTDLPKPIGAFSSLSRLQEKIRACG
jgi:hypothetical protein